MALSNYQQDQNRRALEALLANPNTSITVQVNMYSYSGSAFSRTLSKHKSLDEAITACDAARKSGRHRFAFIEVAETFMYVPE